MRDLKVFIISAFLCAAALGVAHAQDSGTIADNALKLYKQKKYAQAASEYERALSLDPGSGFLYFNLGEAQFKNNEFAKAAQSYERALVTPDKGLERKAVYNLANTRYKLGKEEEPQDLQGAAQDMSQSCQLYKRAVKLDRRDKDAKFNLELASRELKRMQEKLKQMPPQEKKQQNGQGQDKEQSQPQEQKGKEGQEKQQSSQEEKKKEEASQSSPSQDQKNKEGQEKSQGAAALDQKEMSPQEAKMLLDGYRQEEAEQGTLRDKEQHELESVSKDW